jgi:hypothetical protein
MVLRAVRDGHLYIAVDGIATPTAFELTATNAVGTVGTGDRIATGGPVTLRVRSNAPNGFATTVFDGTTAIAVDRHEPEFSLSLPAGGGVYWAEIRAAGKRANVPWITSNPVYVRNAESPAPAAAPRVVNTSTPLFDDRTTTSWHIESDSISLGAVDVAASLTAEKALRLRFGLASGPPANQFVALAIDTPHGAAPHDRVSFAARAERPMRISVQLRAGRSRWARSVYVDTVNQPHVIRFADFRGVDEGAQGPVPVDDVKTVLFVVDTTNSKPGSSGRLWIAAPALQE